ncbi:MAG: prepilin-type N-terminal cleavage/methylation domain-containing protein [Pseudomonadota bacterium]
MRSHPPQAAGFTLLEVMVAMTITGLALGGLFGVVAGNKRLAYNSEQALLESMQVRSLINFTQLNDQRGEIIIDFENTELELEDDLVLDVPERKTMGSPQALRAYEIRDENDELVASGSYRVTLDLPEK